LSLPFCPDHLWGPPSLPCSGYWELFPWRCSDWNIKLTIQLLLVLRLEICGAVPLLSHVSSWQGVSLSTGTILPYFMTVDVCWDQGTHTVH